MQVSLDEIQREAVQALERVANEQELERFRIAYLGKKGKITFLLDRIKEVPGEERKDYGRKVNELKGLILQAFENKGSQVAGSASTKETFDETLPAIAPPKGAVHPITETIREICWIFERMGFEIVEGPEIETEFYNFTALNIPLDHPSREAFDTFYTQSGHLLRSQTSTVQIRVMQDRKPPLRIIAPGRVYRPDTVDASHSFMFHQIEGLLVDTAATFSDLKGVLHCFLQALFGDSLKIRFRPHFFPFTEPSVEVDIQWGKKGWLEILGAGCVDPNVFKAVNYDIKKCQGFAFGLGVERIAMLRHGITDIRYFYENDLRFLRQLG